MIRIIKPIRSRRSFLLEFFPSEKTEKQLAHVAERRDFDISSGMLDQCLRNIANNSGNFGGCLRALMSHSEASALAAWFEAGDILSFKQWAYVRAKLEYILMQPPLGEEVGEVAFEYRAINGLYYLLSGHSGLLEWYSGIDSEFSIARKNNAKTFDYWTTQFFIALRGDWDVLRERCERVIANPPTSAREKRFLIDHQFYLALANGDSAGMEAVIKELVSPKLISKRTPLESGFSANLICTPAIIYSKLAWRAGHNIDVQSPYVPSEWLPAAPLAKYTEAFDFMSSFVV